jgi:hypothetical protein
MCKGSKLQRLLAISLAVTVSLVCLSAASAQSGRRTNKSAATPAPTPEPARTDDKPKEKERPPVTFIVGVDRYFGFSSITLSYYDSIARACGGRLDDTPGVVVQFAGTDMSRGEAAVRAKAEKEAFVVWLQIQVQNSSGDPSVVNNLNQLFIEYTVFAPTTAKSLAWGHTYQQGTRAGAVVVGPGTSGRSNVDLSERRLREAAREAAERILKSLKLGMPIPQPPA